MWLVRLHAVRETLANLDERLRRGGPDRAPP
jgi:hypothetical protein